MWTLSYAISWEVLRRHSVFFLWCCCAGTSKWPDCVMKISERNSTFLTRIFLESLKKHCFSRYDLFLWWSHTSLTKCHALCLCSKLGWLYYSGYVIHERLVISLCYFFPKPSRELLIPLLRINESLVPKYKEGKMDTHTPTQIVKLAYATRLREMLSKQKICVAW